MLAESPVGKGTPRSNANGCDLPIPLLIGRMAGVEVQAGDVWHHKSTRGGVKRATRGLFYSRRIPVALRAGEASDNAIRVGRSVPCLSM